MNLYSKLAKRPNIFKAVTGLSLQDFNKVIILLHPKWLEKEINSKKKSARPYKIDSLHGKLMCLLIYYRVHSTQLFIGFIFSVDAATICRTIKRLEPLLLGVVEIKKEKVLTQQELETIIADCTEQRIERPKYAQKPFYSGKKKAHTIKTEVRVSKQGRIIGISKSVPGSMHDFSLHKKSGPLPKEATCLFDSGYRGVEKLHSKSRIPKRKPHKRPLSSADKEFNRRLASQRVSIEHKIGELKRYRILKDVYRNPIAGYGVKMAIIAGITNVRCGF